MKRVHIWHPLLAVVPKYNKLEFARLSKEIKTSSDCRSDLIMQLLALGRMVLCNAIEHSPSMRQYIDDAVGAITVTACEIADIIAKDTREIKQAYVTRSYYHVLTNLRCSMLSIVDTPRTHRRRFNQGHTPIQRIKLDENLLLIYPEYLLQDLQIDLRSCTNTELELNILNLWLERYSYKEIAERLSVYPSLVFNTIKRILKRYGVKHDS